VFLEVVSADKKETKLWCYFLLGKQADTHTCG